MGTSGSKPDWYPGEPADNLKAPCSCRSGHAPQNRAGIIFENADPGSPAACREAHAACGGGGARKETQERDIMSLPVVPLTDMQYIANGAFCSVYACKYRGWSVVAKRVRHDLPLSERKAALVNLWTEYDCLRDLRHPNVIDVYGMCRVRCREGYDDWNEKDVCLLVEQLAFGTVGHLFGTIVPTEKNLASAMARSRKMKMVPFRCRLHRARELAQALAYMHGGAGTGAMMHRDIKSVNVGFAQNGSLKLMDFGLSKIAPAGSTLDDTFKMTGEVGSYRYMAPELVRHEPYNSKVDIYSWAILSWEMLAVDKPYAGIGESTFIKKVVMGGDRPEFRKSWPDRLCKLLAAAWHADHTKRPAASEIVATLKIVESELSAKDKRRPSHTASPAMPGGFGARSSAGAGRRHSWTQMSSTGGPSGLSVTRLPSGSGTDSGTSGKNGGGAAQVPPLSSPVRSPGSDSQKFKKSSSLPMPLPPARAASNPTPTPTKRRPSLRWFSGRRRTSSPSSGSRPNLTEEAASALDASGGSGGCSGGGGIGSRRGSFSTILVGTAVGHEAGREERVGSGIGVDAQDRAPRGTSTGAAAAATRADGGGCCDGRGCQLRQAFISQRGLISDALARETEGLLLSSGGTARSSSLGIAATTTSKAAVEPDNKPSESSNGLTLGDANNRAAIDHRANAVTGSGVVEDSGHESGVAAPPAPGRGGVNAGGSGGEENTPDSSSNSTDSRTAAKMPKVSSTAPAATVVAKKVLDAPAVPDVPRPMRRNSGIGKLWPSTSSSGRSKDTDAAAVGEVTNTQPVVVPDGSSQTLGNGGLGKPWPSTSSSGRSKDKGAAAVDEAEDTRLATSGAVSMNDGGVEGGNGTAETATE